MVLQSGGSQESVRSGGRVHVLGAGPVGLLLTALLQPRDGPAVHLYEKRGDYTRTRMVKLAPHLTAETVDEYRDGHFDAENVEAVFDRADLETGLALRQAIPPDLAQLLRSWTLGFVPLNAIERALSELIDAREAHPVQRTAVALTAEEAIALLEPGDVVIDCTGTRSLLRERVVPDAGEGDGNKVFPDLVGPQLDALGRRAERLSFAAGDTIIAEGDPADRFFVVVGGEVEISRRSAEGEEVKLAKLGRSQFFGEIGILAETHRTATVRAVGDVELMALTWQEFQETLERSDRAERDFAEIARERLAHATSVAGDSGVRRP